MPWAVERRGDESCVIKESDGSSAGCHVSKTRALAQQRALYANEAQTASAESPLKLELTQPPRSTDVEEALVASISAVSDRLQESEELMGQVVEALAKVVEAQNVDREAFQDALTAAVNRPEPEAPVVNVYVPEIVIPTPTVNVHVPKTKLLVPAPVVNVQLPGTKRTVKFDRDPLTGHRRNIRPWLHDGERDAGERRSL